MSPLMLCVLVLLCLLCVDVVAAREFSRSAVTVPHVAPAAQLTQSPSLAPGTLSWASSDLFISMPDPRETSGPVYINLNVHMQPATAKVEYSNIFHYARPVTFTVTVQSTVYMCDYVQVGPMNRCILVVPAQSDWHVAVYDCTSANSSVAACLSQNVQLGNVSYSALGMDEIASCNSVNSWTPYCSGFTATYQFTVTDRHDANALTLYNGVYYSYNTVYNADSTTVTMGFNPSMVYGSQSQQVLPYFHMKLRSLQRQNSNQTFVDTFSSDTSPSFVVPGWVTEWDCPSAVNQEYAPPTIVTGALLTAKGRFGDVGSTSSAVCSFVQYSYKPIVTTPCDIVVDAAQCQCTVPAAATAEFAQFNFPVQVYLNITYDVGSLFTLGYQSNGQGQGNYYMFYPAPSNNKDNTPMIVGLSCGIGAVVIIGVALLIRRRIRKNAQIQQPLLHQTWA